MQISHRFKAIFYINNYVLLYSLFFYFSLLLACTTMTILTQMFNSRTWTIEFSIQFDQWVKY